MMPPWPGSPRPRRTCLHSSCAPARASAPLRASPLRIVGGGGERGERAAQRRHPRRPEATRVSSAKCARAAASRSLGSLKRPWGHPSCFFISAARTDERERGQQGRQQRGPHRTAPASRFGGKVCFGGVLASRLQQFEALDLVGGRIMRAAGRAPRIWRAQRWRRHEPSGLAARRYRLQRGLQRCAACI